jgi:hypothetical protein
MLIDLERYTRLARIQKRYYITIASIKNILKNIKNIQGRKRGIGR